MDVKDNRNLLLVGQNTVSQNLPINFKNYQKGQHGFDAYDDNDQSREIMKKTVRNGSQNSKLYLDLSIQLKER